MFWNALHLILQSLLTISNKKFCFSHSWMYHTGFDTWTPWCKLLSQYSQNPHVPICHPVFNIGSSKQCNFSFKDKSTSSILCKINHTQRDGSVIAVLETTGAKGSVQVNGKFIKRKTSYVLKSGDEVIFNSPGHAYIFQQFTTETAAEVPSPVGVSAVAGASILASLSSLRQDLSFLTPPAQTTSEVPEASEISSHPFARDSPNMNVDGRGVRKKFHSSTGCDKASEVGETGKSIPFGNSQDAQDSGLESDNVRNFEVNQGLSCRCVLDLLTVTSESVNMNELLQ